MINEAGESTMRKRGGDNNYYIGSNIRTARMRAALTQEKLSEMIGVTPQYLSDLERGLVGTSISTLIRICTELNVSSDFILFGSSSDVDPANSALIEKIQRLPKHKADILERYIDFVFEIMDMDPNQRTSK
jgi:transcriptional regulator with XRE-family HTH domain